MLPSLRVENNHLMLTARIPAIVYCEGAFNTTNGKTAHGLVRFTERYDIIAVIDSNYAGKDAGEVLDGKKKGIIISASVDNALDYARSKGIQPTEMLVGLAPDGGKMPPDALNDIRKAIRNGLNIVSGLHDFLSENPSVVDLAKKHQVSLLDIRRPPGRDQLHFFSGKIEQVNCLKLAVLGTDSALGKRTTAWILVHGLQKAGYKAEMIGTGQTAWLQGAEYSIVMDSLVNDFVSGEIEHAVFSAWQDKNPDVIIIEGQGSLLNPAYPGGFEILAAGRPDYVILQHAPRRIEYDGFPGYIIHPLDHQINALEVISGKKVIAITINHEAMDPDEIPAECDKIAKETGLPCFDVLTMGGEGITRVLEKYIKNHQNG